MHLCFIDSTSSSSVLGGARLAKVHNRMKLYCYNSMKGFYEMLTQQHTGPIYVTLYLECMRHGKSLDLVPILAAFSQSRYRGRLAGITLIIDDRKGLGKIGPHDLGYHDLMESRHGTSFLEDQCRQIPAPVSFILAGSWYDAFRHQGGYILGNASTVESLSWNAKAYFFSTPPMPMQAAMTQAMLETLKYGKTGTM